MEETKKVLVIIPYHFYPPMNGGSLRCYNVVTELKKYFSVGVVTNQQFDLNEKIIGREFNNVKFYFTDSKKIRYGFLNYLLPEKLLNLFYFKFFNWKGMKYFFRRGNTNTMFLEFRPILKVALKNFKPDVAIFENLESLYFFRNIVKRYNSGIKLIYEAHNIDHLLWRQMAVADNNNSEYLKYSVNALELESSLSEFADCVVCVTKQDERILKELSNGKNIFITTVASGVSTLAKRPVNKEFNNSISNILFCGSLDYLPNSEGIKWFYTEVMPLLRKRINGFKVVIIGNCQTLDHYDYLKNDQQIQLIGPVEDVTPYYHSSDLSIVPILSGSGIRLKIMEAMSYGCPVVSTTLGAEGIDYNEDSIIIGDSPQSFADGIISLSNDTSLRKKLAENGRQLVELNYDWEKLMNDFKNIINTLN